MQPNMSPSSEQFLDWLETAGPQGGVESMLIDYRRWLEENGASEEESAAAVGAVLQSLKESHEPWAPMFDRIYSSPDPAFRTAPNRLLVDVTRDVRAGRALDMCCGQGRNAIWLAEHGWQVTGFDVSEEGLAAAGSHARAAGVAATFVRETAAAFEYGRGRWDLISAFYAPVPLADAAYVERLARALAPGGLIVAESFASQTGAPRRKPVDIDPEAIALSFTGLDMRRLDVVNDQPDWTDGPQALVRLVAQKADGP